MRPTQTGHLVSIQQSAFYIYLKPSRFHQTQDCKFARPRAKPASQPVWQQTSSRDINLARQRANSGAPNYAELIVAIIKIMVIIIMMVMRLRLSSFKATRYVLKGDGGDASKQSHFCITSTYLCTYTYPCVSSSLRNTLYLESILPVCVSASLTKSSRSSQTEG